jgi:hypothetical protein
MRTTAVGAVGDIARLLEMKEAANEAASVCSQWAVATVGRRN